LASLKARAKLLKLLQTEEKPYLNIKKHLTLRGVKLCNMKRILSVFLLIIMAFASVQTTWNRHYCGGILRSVTLADGNSACCCGDENQIEKNNSQGLPQINKFCCSDYLLDIVTDNFDLSHVTIGTVWFMSKAFLCHDDSLKLSEPESFSVLQYIFPPGRLAKYNADLLTLICIFRI
jgi:hypothetical protein